MERYLQKIVTCNVIYLVGFFKSTDKEIFSLLKMRRIKDELKVLENTSFEDFDGLLKQLQPSIPIIVLADGKGVLNKKIDLNEIVDTDWLNHLDYTGIYFTSYRTVDYEFFSFCRQNLIDELVEKISIRGLTVIDFYIGASVALLMNETLDREEYYSNTTIIECINNTPIGFKKSEDLVDVNYKIGNDSVSNFHLPLYGATVDFFTKSSSIHKSEPDLKNKSEFIFRKAFEKVGAFVLGSFFLSLLVSYISIQYLIQKNAKFALENSYSGKSFEEIKALEKKLNSKMNILSETGLSSRNYISFYCCQISATLPNELLLNTLEVNPLQKEVKKTEKLTFNAKQIYIKGETQNKSVLNEWLEQLKEKKWIDRLEIVSIKKDKKDNTFFELKILISDV